MRSDLEQCAVRVMNGGVTPKSSSQEDTVQVPSHHNGKANCVSDDMKDLSLQVNRLLPPLAKKRNALKSPAAFQEQRRSIERSKTGDFLRHKIRGRQEKSDLLNMHILRDSATEGSVQATQMKLKRARLADDLNQKIALRPGPLELVEKNIIPVDSAIKEAAMKVNHGKFLKEEDSYAFEEDSSSDSLSPEQPHSNESQGSVCSSSETKSSDSSSPALAGTRQGSQNLDHNGSPTSHVSQEESLSMMNNSQLTQPIAVPAIVKSKTSDKNRHKKPKDTKPKVKKLKYHQYIPPDQKAEKSPPPMDSAYARLLQQQQLFLQLQILSQQKHQQHSHQRQQNFSFQPLHSSLKQSNEQLPRNSNVSTSNVTSTSASPVKTTYSAQINVSAIKPGPLPSNLDDLKVSELRQQLRIRGLPVSGTKTALIERLRPFKDPSSSSPSSSSDITTVTFPVTPTGSLSSYHSPSSSSALSNGGFYQLCSNSTTPPISPASSDLSVSGSLPDSFSDVTMSSPQFSLHASPRADDGLAAALSGGRLHPEPEGLDAEKDKMLVEKQKVIEELTWKLHQEQRQVEELKMQLHKRKRSHCQQALPQQQAHLHPLPPQQQTIFGVSIKQEHVASSCPLSSKQLKGPPRSCMESLAPCASTVLSNLGGPRCLDASAAGSPAGLSAFLSPQCSPQHSPIAKTASSPQHSSLSSSPNSPYLLSVSSTRGAGDGQSHSPQQSGNRPRTIQIPQKNSGPTVSCSFAPDQRGLTPAFSNSANSGFNRDQHKPKGASIQHKMAILHPRHVGQKCPISSAAFCSSDSAASEIKQPPCYEDAVKQQLTRSQQMDELLDVLIESGEMPANAKEERPCVTKVVPHITVSGGSGISVPKFPRHYEHLPPGQVPFEHAASNGDSHLEALLNSPMGRASEAALLKMSTGERQLEDGGESFTGTHQEKMLGNRDMMEMPLSPMDARISPAAEAQGLSMPFTESPWETMEWLDLTPPSSATGFSTIPQAAPNIFNAEFLDVTDIHLNSTMDLHLEQW
uniref:Myocardin n=1 Tax=Paramormyrops kingsleyae TaxID=1676925 RepID=A0A3B3RFE2_9TELE|nr:myocardin isoform X1 [Paramormyrops kingsleyae]XP_023693022.1 myocardin isoform X1 [Paramormyrops kingsleyae]XP_023693023.1 myocardin isoform X1 [Paramormyrops kingsleyae]